MNRTFPLLIILLMSTVSTLMREPRLQGEPLQNAGAGQFKASILREDGVLIPFAEYRDGKWSAPWPKREGYGDSENSLAELPEAWFVKGNEFSAIWYFRPTDGPPKTLKAGQTVKVQSHCQENWGLSSDYPGKPVKANTVHHNLGIALDLENRIDSPFELTNSSPESQSVISFIQTAFDKAEAPKIREINASINQVSVSNPSRHVTPYPSDDVRKKMKLDIRKLYRCRSAIDKQYIYYFEVRKEYKKSLDSHDATCDYVSAYSGWMRQNNRAGPILLDSQMTLTDCDMKEIEFIKPLGIMTMGERTFIFTEDHEWESESYSIFEISGPGVKRVLKVYGGGC
jgi:hypothetical protein